MLEMLRLRPVAANAVVIAVALFLYSILPLSSMGAPAVLWDVLFCTAVAYLTGYAVWAILRGSRQSKGELVLSLGRKIVLENWDSTTPAERLALRAVIVKFIYIPMMFSFMIGNGSSFLTMIASVLDGSRINLWSVASFNMTWYPIFFYMLLLTDVSFFAFGYVVDHPLFGNVIRSVDATFLGWASALMCYPPFNSATNAVLGWYASDANGPFYTMWGVTAFNVVSLILFTIYVWATVSLGAKSSNLTNRGIVARGPYAYVRHPAYAAKNAVWIISVLPLMNLAAYASVLAWAGIYYVRAITEERHLSHDPDYLAYKQAVRWRFIPYIW